MNPFFLGAAIRAVRLKGAPVGGGRGRKPMWWLLLWLVWDSVRSLGPRRLGALAAGLGAFAGMVIALSEATPGPVLPDPDRWVAASVVVVMATVVSRLLPRDLRVPLWGVTAVMVAVIEVGLHHATPGPVLHVPVRWLTAAGLLAVIVVLFRRDGGDLGRLRDGNGP